MKRLGKQITWLKCSLVALTICVVAWPRQAFGYRPFDLTDADVADNGEFELELGPVGYLREGREKFLIVPAMIFNFGIADDREIVLEGKVEKPISDSQEGTRTGLVDAGLFIKQVLKRGALQDATGPSIATEYGLLLPGINQDPGVGASLAGIFSQRWAYATLHLNTAAAYTREHRGDLLLGGILEGPYHWQLRPAMEVFGENEEGQPWTVSGLLGLIWRETDDLSFDFGVRVARASNQGVLEIRAGFTWSFPYRRWHDGGKKDI